MGYISRKSIVVNIKNLKKRSIDKSYWNKLSRMVHDDALGCEVGSFLGRVILGVGCNKTTLEILDCNILNIESDIVSWKSLSESLVVHLNKLNLSCQTSRSKSYKHTGLHNTSFNTSPWHNSNTTNLVNILQWKPERLCLRVSWVWLLHE